MAYERAWQFSYNNPYTPTSNLDQTKFQVWMLKSMLLGQTGSLTGTGLWTIDSSCNSVAAGTQGDGQDRWHSGTYTPGDIVQAAAASAHSWFVLKSPLMNGFNFYLLLATDSVTTTNASVLMAKAPFTGGTTTANPTSADSWLVGTAAGGSTWNAGNSSGILNRFNMALTSLGDFVFFPVQVGQATPNFASLCIGVVAPIGTAAADPFPIWTQKFFQVTTPGGFAGTQLAAASIQASRGPSPAAGFVVLIAPSQALLVNNNLDLFSNAQVDLPAWVAFQSTTTWGMRGRLPDIKYIPQATTPFQSGSFMRDVSNNITYVSVGCLWVPSGNSPPLFS